MSDKLSSNAGFKWNEKALVDLLNLCIYFKCFVKSKEHNEYIALWKQLHRNLRNNREKTPKKTQTNKQNDNAKKYQLILYRCKQTINTNRSLDIERNYNDCRYSHLFLRLFSEELVIFLREAEG